MSDKEHRISKKSKSTSSIASDRMLTDVLLSIKPLYLANVASRQKNHEYRKYRLRDGVTRLWFYETGDGGRGRASITCVNFSLSTSPFKSPSAPPVVLCCPLQLISSRHIAVILASIRHTPGSVPAEPFGIGNAEFNAGLKESKYGYPILELFELVQPVTLVEMKSRWGMGGASMGWQYVGRDLWQDRWEGNQGRAEKARQVF